jgi:hypothetical protein
MTSVLGSVREVRFLALARWRGASTTGSFVDPPMPGRAQDWATAPSAKCLVGPRYPPDMPAALCARQEPRRSQHTLG